MSQATTTGCSFRDGVQLPRAATGTECNYQDGVQRAATATSVATELPRYRDQCCSRRSALTRTACSYRDGVHLPATETSVATDGVQLPGRRAATETSVAPATEGNYQDGAECNYRDECNYQDGYRDQ